MPLAEQYAEIPLNGGLNTKRDVDRNDPQQFAEAVTDLRFGRLGELEKRPTHDADVIINNQSASQSYDYSYSATGVSTSNTEYLTGVFSRGAEACALGTQLGVQVVANAALQSAYPAAETATALPSAYNEPILGYAPRQCSVSRKTLFSATQQELSQGVRAHTCALAGSHLVVAWTETRDVSNDTLIWIKAIDPDTGAQIVPPIWVDMGQQTVSIQSISLNTTKAIVTYAELGVAPQTIYCISYDSVTRSFSQEANATTNATYSTHFLYQLAANDILIGYQDNTSGFMTVKRFSDAFVTLTSTHTATHAMYAGAAVKGTNATLIVSTDTTAGGTVWCEKLGTPGTTLTLHTLGASEAAIWVGVCDEPRITAGGVGVTDCAAVFVSGTDDAGVSSHSRTSGTQTFTRVSLVEYDGAMSTLTTRKMWHTRALACFTYDYRAYGIFNTPVDAFKNDLSSCVVARVAGYEDWQATYWRLRVDPIARFAHDRCFDSLVGAISGVATSAVVSGDRVYTTRTLDASPDTMLSLSMKEPQTVALFTLDFRRQPTVTHDFGDVVLGSSGVLWEYDGLQVELAQPLHAPQVYLGDNGAGTGQITGTVSAIAIYTWVDAAGRLHRSAPSEADSITVTGKRVDAYVTIPQFEAHDANAAATWPQPIGVELYVTENGGTSYYLANDSSGYKDFFDTTTNGYFKFSAIQLGVSTNPQLYSDGSAAAELVSEPPPAMQCIAVVGDRMWGIDAEDRTRIWASKPFVSGYAVEWNTAGTLSIGDNGVAVADVGGVPTVFGERGIWQIFGEGPNALGSGTFAPARRLPYEVTTISEHIARTPQGVAFRTTKGVMLLDAGGQLQRIGEPIEVLTRTTLRSTTAPTQSTWWQRLAYDSRNEELRLIDKDAGYFVYSFRENKWTKWTQSTSIAYAYDVASVAGRMWYAHYNGTNFYMRSEKVAGETDYNGQSHGWTYQTPWIRFDGITGGVRIWRVAVVLSGADHPTAPDPWFASYVTSVVVTYTSRESTAETFTWTGAQLEALFNEQNNSSSNDDLNASLVCQPAAQKTHAFRISITQTDSSSVLNGARPVALRVWYGVDPKYARRKGADSLRGAVVPS